MAASIGWVRLGLDKVGERRAKGVSRCPPTLALTGRPKYVCGGERAMKVCISLFMTVLFSTGCSDSDRKAFLTSRCEAALMPSSPYLTKTRVDTLSIYPDDAPPVLLKPEVTEYRQQTVAANFGFGYNDVFSVDDADLIVRTVRNLSYETSDTSTATLYSNNYCVLQKNQDLYVKPLKNV